LGKVIHLSADPAVVRQWRSDDASDLALQANDRRVWLNMRDAFPHPYAIEDAERFIAMTLEKSPPTFLAIELSGRIAGGIGYTLHTDVDRVSAEVGYWLGHEFWGHGVGTAALRALTGHAFRSHEGLRRLCAVPFASNPASARVLQKAGYRCEATLRESVIKDGQILDQWMYVILREEWQRTKRAAHNRARTSRLLWRTRRRARSSRGAGPRAGRGAA
jgi:ribosomal-protein-alanine N-acetyltransferase